MTVLSLINIQRSCFKEVKDSFESIFQNGKVIDLSRCWLNYKQPSKAGQSLTTIIFHVEIAQLSSVLSVINEHKADLIASNGKEEIEIGINSDKINVLNTSMEERDLICSDLQQSIQGIAVAPDRSESKLTLQFLSPHEQSLALEQLLNFTQILEYNFQGIFVYDLSVQCNSTDTAQMISRLARTESVLNRKRKPCNSSTESISEEFEGATTKVLKNNQGSAAARKNFKTDDIIQIILAIILVSTVFVVSRAKGVL